MKKCVYFLVVPLVAVLAIGCGSETSPPPPSASTPPPDTKGGSKLAVKKKKKEPGIGAIPTTSKARPSEL